MLILIVYMQNKLEFKTVYINIILYIPKNKFCVTNAISQNSITSWLVHSKAHFMIWSRDEAMVHQSKLFWAQFFFRSLQFSTDHVTCVCNKCQMWIIERPQVSLYEQISLYNSISFGLRYLERFCCKGYLIALQEFKRNEGRVQRT